MRKKTELGAGMEFSLCDVLSEFSSFHLAGLSNFKMHFAFVWHNLIVVNALPFQMFHFVTSMLLMYVSVFVRLFLCMRTHFLFLWQAADMNQKWIFHSAAESLLELQNTNRNDYGGDDYEISLSSLLSKIMVSSGGLLFESHCSTVCLIFLFSWLFLFLPGKMFSKSN